MSDRRRHILLVVENLREQHRQWVDSETVHLTEAVEAALEETLEILAHGDLPESCRALYDRSVRLQAEWDDFRQSAQRGSNPEQAMPPQRFWKALELLLQAGRDAKPKPQVVLETIQQLTEQKVGDNQICKIYGWVDEDGRPEMWRLLEERGQPGKHTGAGWQSPAERAAKDRDAREDASFRQLQTRLSAKQSAAAIMGPESWSQLFEENLSARQCSKIKNCSIEEVYAAADELGVPRPELDYASPQATRGTFERPLDPITERMIDAGAKKPPSPKPKPSAKPAAKPSAKPNGNPASKAKSSATKSKTQDPRPKTSATAMDEATREQILALAGQGLAPAEIGEMLADAELSLDEIERVAAEAETVEA